MQTYVFDIQSFSIHDGPGIRTTVFLKGCPLHCRWCHNLESQNREPEIFYYQEKCTGCGRCMDACSHKAITIEGSLAITNRSKCDACGNCVQVCSNEARELIGQQMELAQLMERIDKDKMFFENSGGVTISGGEPLINPSYTKEIIHKCKEANINVAVETCGYASEEIVKEVLQEVDLVLFDLKMMDEELHWKWTGCSNAIILRNAKMIARTMNKRMVIRIPVIKGINDTVGNMQQTADFMKAYLRADIPVHLLPYHNLGESKGIRLERGEYDREEKIEEVKLENPAEHELKALCQIFEASGIQAQVGGSM